MGSAVALLTLLSAVLDSQSAAPWAWRALSARVAKYLLHLISISGSYDITSHPKRYLEGSVGLRNRVFHRLAPSLPFETDLRKRLSCC